ncbi:MAG: cyclic nucleotide-binding domain-containing protein [Alphaproteobacteria bacterium]|nr:cyclic nucleotide-binding domain-containing protein [Alphaproteobacteria bacterium]
MQAISPAAARHFPPAALAMRGPAAIPRRPAAEPGVRLRFAKGEAIYTEGDEAERFYRIVSGTVRICKMLHDGRRQIEAFHFARDIFGLERGDGHRFTAEAVDDVVVLAFRARGLEDLIRDDPDLGGELMTSLLSSLDRARDHLVLLGRKSAREKIAAFLLDIAERLSGDDHFELPMQRGDIADHLGLTIETVSRTLTRMARDGLIGLQACGRTVEILNRDGLTAADAG